MMINREQPRRHSEAINNRIFIINYNSQEEQDFLWSQFQECAMRSQQNPTLENIMQAKAAHAVWAQSFLNEGGAANV